MKVYSCPEQVPAPDFNYNTYAEDEKAHSERLKAHLITSGYQGPNTGKIWRTPEADGYAMYMVADAPRGFCLVHLPYCDGYRSRLASRMTKKDILADIARDEKIMALFSKK
jgi:hypothetical protein